MMQHENSPYHQYQRPLGTWVNDLGWRVRREMFDALMKACRPSPTTAVLDLGVTSEATRSQNFFEELYPYPERIVAVGQEDAAYLEKAHPGLKFVKADGTRLPFDDQSFDLVVSFAVVEHVGSRER